VSQVVQSTTFHAGPRRADAVTNKTTMLSRMEENLVHWGYHLAIPGHILEMGAEELAELLTSARTGALWQGKNSYGVPAVASAHASATPKASAREPEEAHRPKERR
jgi:hypothetical protein